jgi:FkbM family methyltransferase
MSLPEEARRLPYFPNHLFYLLCAAFKPQVICDVGSRDGAASLRFRRVSPPSRIVAFEANPVNFARLQANDALTKANIVVEPLAVSDQVGRVSFFPVETNGTPEWTSGAGSLYKRTDDLRYGQIEVDATTLDRYLLEDRPLPPGGDVALWLDVEGAAYSVIAGASKVLERTKFLQVEVERRAIWQGQKTGSDVDRILRDNGFLPFAQPSGPEEQVDVLYVAKDFWRSNRIKLYALLAAAVALLQVRKLLPSRI